MGLGLGHAPFLDQIAFCAVNKPQLGDFIQQLCILGAQHGQPLVVAGRDLYGLPELDRREWLAQHQHTEILQLVGDLLGGAGLGQQNDAGIGLLHCVRAQLMTELVRQGRVDEDDLPVRVGKTPPRLGAGSHGGYVPRAHVRQHSAQHIAALFSAGYDQRARQRPHPLAAPKYYIL